MKKFVLIAPLILALLAVPAFAAGFTISVGPAGDVFAEDTLEVTITLHNDAGAAELFLISQPLAAPPANKWASMDKGSISVPAYSDGTFKMKITPTDDAKSGDYRYEFTVRKQSTSEMLAKEFQITVRQREAAAVVRLELSCLTCTEKVAVTADVENVGTAKIKDAKVRISLGEKTEELAVGDMNISGKKRLNLEFDIANWKPSNYEMAAELSASGQSLDRKTAAFTIPEINNVTMAQVTQITPWSRTVTYKLANLGNMPGKEEIKAQVTQSAMVSISYSKPPVANGDQWIWTADLQPGEKEDISYTEFYWPIPIIIVLLALGATYTYLFATSIGMKKTLSKKGDEWSVGIAIKNRGSAAEGVVVRDVIPHHFSLSGTFETLKPIARKTDVGTELIWRVGGIKRGEEKLLHYRMATKGPFGTVKLPSARLRAQKGDKTILSSTNTVTLTGEKVPIRLKVDTQ